MRCTLMDTAAPVTANHAAPPFMSHRIQLNGHRSEPHEKYVTTPALIRGDIRYAVELKNDLAVGLKARSGCSDRVARSSGRSWVSTWRSAARILRSRSMNHAEIAMS